MKTTSWWDRKNEVYSMLCGEEYTNRAVVLMNIGLVVVLLACGLAEWIGGL